MTKIMIPAWVNNRLNPVEKIAAHKRGLRHKAVSIFVVSPEGDILLQQRAMGKYHTPGLWANTCCTHPHWGEIAEDCAQRRLEEELGISGLFHEYRGRVEYRAEVGNGLIEHEVVDVYLATAPRDLVFEPNPDEVMATRWISVAELRDELARTPDKFTPWLKIYMAEHSGLILGEPATV